MSHHLTRADDLIEAIARTRTAGNHPGGRRAAAQVYLDTALARGTVVHAWMPADRATAVVALLLPGRTALLLAAPPRGQDPALVTLLGAASRFCLSQGVSFIQAQVEPADQKLAHCLREAQFQRLTGLDYLFRQVGALAAPGPVDARVIFSALPQTGAGRLAAVIDASYRDSLDCPELYGLRTMDDVLAAHAAAGPPDPALWEIASVDQADVGCLLLAHHSADALLEIVYMGVPARQRGRGVGAALLTRALQQCRLRGAARLCAAVDVRNAPARRLYARFDMRSVGERDVYWRRGSA